MKFTVNAMSVAMLLALLTLSACNPGATDAPTAAPATTSEQVAEQPVAAPIAPTDAPTTVAPEEPSAAESTDAPEPDGVTDTATDTATDADDATEASESDSAPQTDASEADAGKWEEGPVTFKSESLHGNMTASGEPFDKDALTAAHKTLPFGTQVTVVNLFNGLSTVVTINDRLPQHVSAVIDLSPAAAREIDMIDAGIVDGRIEW